MDQKKVLMVCLGNICRSPIAEGVFSKLVKERGEESKWIVDSAALSSWNVGCTPDERSMQIMKKYQIPYNNTARQIIEKDFHEFDYIFGMDESNISELKSRAPKNCKAKIYLLGDFHPEGDRIIRDPYYDHNNQGFEKCYQQCLKSITNFLNQAKEKKV